MFRVAGAPVLAGTGLKGLFRSRTEYILRSVGATPAPCGTQQCGTCWTCQVFGSGGGQDTGAEAVGIRSVIRIPDAAVHEPAEVRRTHIAIDRFTGGVLPGALYTMEALESGSFTLQVEQIAALDAHRAEEIRAVLRLVLEDLHDGITGIGGGVARGYGSVSVRFRRGGGRRAAERRRGPPRADPDAGGTVSPSPPDGRMTWTEAVAGPLAGATCLWQDLDGLHVSAAPGAAPPTSILWAWRPDSWLIRARLDGDVAFVAVHDGTGLTRTVPWDAGDGDSAGDLRVAASRGRGPGPEGSGAGARYEQVAVDGIGDLAGPITFIRPG